MNNENKEPTTNDLLSAYVADNENSANNEKANERPAQPKVKPSFSSATQVNPQLMGLTGNSQAAEQAKVAQVTPVQKSATNMRKPADSPFEYKDNLGWLPVEVESLPTAGLFYPKETKILIRAARGAEIKHWSTMNDQDLNEVSRTDDIMNYVIEKCVNVQMPGSATGGTWKDLKDIDRFYLLLAIREFTFLDGDNELMIPISENKEIPVTKEMIDFIKIPEKIMKYYSEEERCFVFKLPMRELRMYIPSLGATQWLKNYAQAKANAREGFDSDFLIFAPMLIGDFRLLSQRAYEGMVEESSMWSTKEWSLISYVRDELAKASEPKLTYRDENGSEVTVPLTFRGGLKALFTIQDPLSILG